VIQTFERESVIRRLAETTMPTDMIFEPERRVPIPATDILTYLFSNPNYDVDKPVCFA
jgi:hypothetical protein